MQEFSSNSDRPKEPTWAPNLEFTIFQNYYERLLKTLPTQTPEDILTIQFHGNLYTELEQALSATLKPLMRKSEWELTDKLEFVRVMAGKQLLDRDRQINLLVLKKLMLERYELTEAHYQAVTSYWQSYIQTHSKYS